MSSLLLDLNSRNKILTARPLQHGYRYPKPQKHFQKFIADTMNWFLFQGWIKTSFATGLSEPEFYDDLVYKCKNKIVRTADFSEQFRKNYQTFQTDWI